MHFTFTGPQRIAQKTCDSLLCHISTHDTWLLSVLFKTTKKFTGTVSGGIRHYQSFTKANTEPAPWLCLCRDSGWKPKPWAGQPAYGGLYQGSPATTSSTTGWIEHRLAAGMQWCEGETPDIGGRKPAQAVLKVVLLSWAGTQLPA